VRSESSAERDIKHALIRVAQFDGRTGKPHGTQIGHRCFSDIFDEKTQCVIGRIHRCPSQVLQRNFLFAMCQNVLLHTPHGIDFFIIIRHFFLLSILYFTTVPYHHTALTALYLDRDCDFTGGQCCFVYNSLL
jgi:hypothetical protein